MAQGPASVDTSNQKSAEASADKAPGKDAGNALASALKRLNDALDGLDKSVSASLEARNKDFDANEQVQRMGEDRARLARDLDDAEARATALKDVNSEVSRRLVNAMETVRGVLDKQG